MQDWQYLNAGIYYYHVKRWFSFFATDQFLFIDFSEFVTSDNIATLNSILLFLVPLGFPLICEEIQQFLGVEVMELPKLALNIAAKKPDMLQTTWEFLRDFYAPYNKLLYDLLQKDFRWDSDIK